MDLNLYTESSMKMMDMYENKIKNIAKNKIALQIREICQNVMKYEEITELQHALADLINQNIGKTLV